ncbi:MAG: ammonium transporter [Cyclobacteriaceae bacterium]
MIKYALTTLLVLSFFIGSSQSDLIRIEKKVNANTQEVKSIQDSLSSLSNALDEQYLETQRVDEKITNGDQQLGEKIDIINKELGIESNKGATSDVDRFWLIICAAFVFLMQAGFKVLEMGMVREIHGPGIGLKNLIDFVATAIIYFVIGFSFMFGYSHNGFIGSGLFMPTAENLEALFQTGFTNYGLEFFLFQMAFAATAATIVSGAMSERTALVPYLLIAMFVAGFIYPIVGHMVWGDLYLENGTAWLANIGFIDFAGSTVVHSTGAWIAIIGIWVIGPRLGRFKLDGSLNKEKFKPSNLGYSILGVFILWFGWWGFNGGSNLKFDYSIATIITNTNLAGAFAAFTALFHAYFFDKENVIEKVIGGTLAGLVSITASAVLVDSIGAMAIGAVAGIIHNFSYDLLLRLKLDDPVGAIPVHGFAGVWGTIAVAIFGKEELIRSYLSISKDQPWERMDQVVSQIMGAGVVLIFVCVASFLFFKLLEATIGLRVDPDKENSGYILISKD